MLLQGSPDELKKKSCTANSGCIADDVCYNLREGDNALLTDPQTHVADVPDCGGTVTIELPGDADDHNWVIYEDGSDEMFGCYLPSTDEGAFCGP